MDNRTEPEHRQAVSFQNPRRLQKELLWKRRPGKAAREALGTGEKGLPGTSIGAAVGELLKEKDALEIMLTVT